MQLDFLQDEQAPLTQEKPQPLKKSKRLEKQLPLLDSGETLLDSPLPPLPESLRPSLVSAPVVEAEDEGDMEKAPGAFRNISETAKFLDVPQHVLRFWESRFSQIKPLKLQGGRRYYRPEDISILATIKHLLYKQGYTIKGAKKAFSSGKRNFVEQDVATDTAPKVVMQMTNQQHIQLGTIRQDLISMRDTLADYMAAR